MKNVGIIKYLSALKEARNERHQLVSLEYVPGHSGDPGNDGADAQANIGTTFEPRPDLDWGSLEARASETINALVYTTRSSEKPAVLPEASSDRPSKFLKSSNPTTFAGSSMTDKSPKAPQAPLAAVIAPTPPPRSSLRPSTKRVDPKPTVYEKPQQQTVAIIPDPPIDFLLPSATRSKDPSLEPAPPRDFHNQSSLPQTSRFQSVPTPEPMKHSRIGSPLKASKVDAPLIPVSSSEIDFNVGPQSFFLCLSNAHGTPRCIKIVYWMVKNGKEKLRICDNCCIYDYFCIILFGVTRKQTEFTN